ncbi:glycosyltransferase [Sphingobacterium daejeonense]|uniref:glycosyltransferase n=1 Tax=Sphingobacterium daejeonense TaxID=371142 RepID=UPI0021A7F16F|nr:glycosyltransferase [Sphingobacterium daejeonense]MCT1529373.1 glycosyltransferase [Sphingobacterium daejeonense]
MEKICFLVCQYGKEVNGGAEYHCRMLAERLVDDYEVDVLTSKTINYSTFEPYYTNEKESLNGVNILRFDCEPYNADVHQNWRKKTKFSRKIRRNLYRLGILETLSNIIPKWDLGIENEEKLMKSHGFYSTSLLSYLESHQKDYKAIICFTYLYPHTVFGSRVAPNKTILIPTVHNDSDIFRSIQTHVFTEVKHIGFNTIEERDFSYKIFGNKMSNNSIIAVGVETDTEHEIPFQQLKEKFHLSENYIHYFGRVCVSKMEKLIPWFINYKSKYPSDLKLVLTGRLFQEKIVHPDIIYTGFVTDEEKIGLIKNSRLIINPSKNESLSLLLLEAMNLGKTVLVNAKSDVMKAHAIRSDFAAEYYTNETDFQNKIQKYISHPNLIALNKSKAMAYVEENYNWQLIINRLKNLISSI